jgi:hypothetical protein
MTLLKLTMNLTMFSPGSQGPWLTATNKGLKEPMEAAWGRRRSQLDPSITQLRVCLCKAWTERSSQGTILCLAFLRGRSGPIGLKRSLKTTIRSISTIRQSKEVRAEENKKELSKWKVKESPLCRISLKARTSREVSPCPTFSSPVSATKFLTRAYPT